MSAVHYDNARSGNALCGLSREHGMGRLSTRPNEVTCDRCLRGVPASAKCEDCGERGWTGEYAYIAEPRSDDANMRLCDECGEYAEQEPMPVQMRRVNPSRHELPIGEPVRLRRFSYTGKPGGTRLSDGSLCGQGEPPFKGDARVRVTKSWHDYEIGMRYHGSPFSTDLRAFMRRWSKPGTAVYFGESDIQ